MHLRPYTIIMSSKTIPCAACCRGGIDVGVPIGPCRMKIRLILKEILPFYFRLVVLAAVTLFIDLILHLTDLVWIGRYLGIPGVILILISFGHSLRKRGVIKSSNPVRLLRLHEWLAWIGATLVDRKSRVWVKSVSVRLDFGGRRIINK